jgi:hypothetical protein
MPITITVANMTELREIFNDLFPTPILTKGKIPIFVGENLPEPVAVTDISPPEKKGKKTKPAETKEDTPVEEPPAPDYANYDAVLLAVGKVKRSNDPDIGVKVKNWLQAHNVVKLAECTVAQFVDLVHDLKLPVAK